MALRETSKDGWVPLEAEPRVVVHGATSGMRVEGLRLLRGFRV